MGLGARNDIRILPAVAIVAIVPPGAEWPRECRSYFVELFSPFISFSIWFQWSAFIILIHCGCHFLYAPSGLPVWSSLALMWDCPVSGHCTIRTAPWGAIGLFPFSAHLLPFIVYVDHSHFHARSPWEFNVFRSRLWNTVHFTVLYFYYALFLPMRLFGLCIHVLYITFPYQIQKFFGIQYLFKVW